MGRLRIQSQRRARHQERVVVPRAEQHLVHRGARYRTRPRAAHLPAGRGPLMRLSPIAGEWIDRSRMLQFRFEGATVHGFAGDTISSALWAQGMRTLGRSFKYHRRRGVLSFADHDANVIVQHGARLNVRADVIAAEPAAQLTAVNTFGSLRSDRGAVLGRLSAVLPVGFYYKAFYSRRMFPMWERMFRRLTGLGRVDFDAPRLHTPKQYGFCDVLVIGAGPSGLAAAVAAGATRSPLG